MLTGIPLMSVFVPKEYVFEFKETKGSVILVNNPKINHFKGELMQEQSKLDNQMNYAMESNLCRRFNAKQKR